MPTLNTDIPTSVSCYRVYAADTDMMGIVYHANYLNFFERARTDMLRGQGISLISLGQQGVHFAIHDIAIRYHYPARLDDLLKIKTDITHVKACTLVFDQKMFNDAGECLSEATIRVVCVDDKLNPRRLPVLD